MAVRSSVRWILIAGYGAVAGVVGWVYLGGEAPGAETADAPVLAERASSSTGNTSRPADAHLRDTHPRDARPGDSRPARLLRPASTSSAAERNEPEDAAVATISAMIGSAFDGDLIRPPRVDGDELTREMEAELAELDVLLAGMGGPDFEYDPAVVRRSVALVQAQLAPSYENGRLRGIEVGELPPSGNVFSDLGLREGYVITAVNGQSVESTGANPWVLMEELGSENGLELEVVDPYGNPETIYVQ